MLDTDSAVADLCLGLVNANVKSLRLVLSLGVLRAMMHMSLRCSANVKHVERVGYGTAVRKAFRS